MRMCVSLNCAALLAFTVASFAAADDKSPASKSHQTGKSQVVVGTIVKIQAKQGRIAVQTQAGGQQIQTQTATKDKTPDTYVLVVDKSTEISNRTKSKTKPGQDASSPLDQLAVGQSVRVVFASVQLAPGQDTDQSQGKLKPGQKDKDKSKVKPGQQDQGQDAKPGQTDKVKPAPQDQNQKVKPGQDDKVKPGQDDKVKPGQQDQGQNVKPGQKDKRKPKGVGQQDDTKVLKALSIEILLAADQSQKNN